MKNDVLGQAIWDYQHGQQAGKLWIHNQYGPREEMPVGTYFRTVAEMPQMERLALQQCRGKVLDIGAGAGAHSLALQQMGLDVTALDISEKALQVAKIRGVKRTIHADIFNLENQQFDTLLLLMNGIGLTGSLQRLRLFLQHAKTLLRSGGQLIFDSSDVAYLYKRNAKPAGRYYGEIIYRYEYKKQKTEPFSWLYVDAKTLTNMATEMGWQTQLLMKDDYDQYLVRLTPKGN